MQKAFKAYGAVFFVDGTYKLFKTDFTLMIFVVEDSNTHTEIAGVCIIVQEDKDTFTWLANSFKEAHKENFDRIDCVMGDKDLTERPVLKEVFGKPLLICRYHALKSFSRGFTHHIHKNGKKYFKLKDKLLAIVKKMFFSKTEQIYDALYEEFCEIAFKEIISYFNSNWHNIKSEWTAHCMCVGNLLNFTNNRLESINKHIKSVVQKRSSLLSFLKDFFIWLNSHNFEIDSTTAEAILKCPVFRHKLSHKSLAEYQNYLMTEPFNLLKKEFLKLESVEIIQCNVKKSFVEDNKLCHEVTSTSCNCQFWKSTQLPSRHILIIRKNLGLPLFDENLCAIRWSKQSL